MKTSVDRIKGFSDAFIAIIITLMILEISLPQTMDTQELMAFFQSILIYGASFIIVGGQWNRHHRLIDELESVSNVFVWENMIYLFILSLVPLFMKWVIQFPSSVIPAPVPPGVNAPIYSARYLRQEHACKASRSAHYAVALQTHT